MKQCEKCGEHEATMEITVRATPYSPLSKERIISDYTESGDVCLMCQNDISEMEGWNVENETVIEKASEIDNDC